MVSLDLALVYAKQGRVADLKQLAEELHSIFESKEIHREALAALLLFQQAAREERLTAPHVEAFIHYFKKAHESIPAVQGAGPAGCTIESALRPSESPAQTGRLGVMRPPQGDAAPAIAEDRSTLSALSR